MSKVLAQARFRYLVSAAVLMLLGISSFSQTGSGTIPVIDGGAGPCSLLLTVAADGKPVLAANVKVHIEYGFGGFHRLDLEAYTNESGMLKFTGIPAKVRRPPLSFQATKNELAGIASWDPAIECEGKHDLPLAKQPQQPPAQ